MPFVVDASVAMAWCFEDEASDDTDAMLERLRDDVALVPALWWLEVSNVLLVAERRRRMSEAQATRFVDLLSRLPIRTDDAPMDPQVLLAAGRRHDLSAYDAAYLVLAVHQGLGLATLERKLAEACQRAGVPLLVPVN